MGDPACSSIRLTAPIRIASSRPITCSSSVTTGSTETSPPTSGSWFNMVERRFAELTNQKFKRGAHTSVRALEKDIRNWIRNWNKDPRSLRPGNDCRRDPQLYDPKLRAGIPGHFTGQSVVKLMML